MAKIDARFMKLDGVTLENFNGNLRQVPGTDGGGGGGGFGNFVEETIPLSPTFSLKYVDLSFEPTDFESVELFIKDVSSETSQKQLRVKDFSLVRNSVGGDYKRIAWDSSSLSSGGNGTAIPDTDTPPTEGMQDVLVSTDSFLIKYLI